MLMLFCFTLLASMRGIEAAADKGAEWCAAVDERWGAPFAWALLAILIVAYCTPTLAIAYLAYLSL